MTDSSETDRLDALRATELLDSLPEERFDRLTRLAKAALGTDVALISLIDADRQWFKSKDGLDLDETPRDIAFCDHAIRGNEIMIVPDATSDDRFQSNPLVTGNTNIRFYAGAPLVTEAGQALGTLCVIDSKPRRDFSEEDAQTLIDLAATVMTEIEAVQQQQLIDDLNVINEELRHRMGNMYAHVSSLISMVGRNEDDKDRLIRRLREKVTTLGQTQALLAANRWASVPMSRLIETVLSPFETPENRTRIHVQSDNDFDVSPRGAFILTLMINELGTNAVKHGALSGGSGEIDVKWSLGDQLVIYWTETAENVSSLDTGSGFGSQILTRIAPMDLQGEAQFDLTETGLKYSVTAKPDRIMSQS